MTIDKLGLVDHWRSLRTRTARSTDAILPSSRTDPAQAAVCFYGNAMTQTPQWL